MTDSKKSNKLNKKVLSALILAASISACGTESEKENVSSKAKLDLSNKKVNLDASNSLKRIEKKVDAAISSQPTCMQM